MKDPTAWAVTKCDVCGAEIVGWMMAQHRAQHTSSPPLGSRHRPTIHIPAGKARQHALFPQARHRIKIL